MVTTASGAPLKRRLLTGGAWSLISKFGGMAAAIITSVLAARIFDPHEMGILNLASSVAWFASILMSFGLGSALVTLIPQYLSSGRSDLLKGAVYGSTLITVIGIIAYSIIYFAFGAKLFSKIAGGGNELEGLSGWVLLWMALLTLQLFLSEVFRGFHDIRGASFQSALLSSLITMLAFIIYKIGGESGSVDQGVSFYVIGLTCSVGVATLGVRRHLTGIKSHVVVPWNRLFTVAWPLFISRLTVYLLCQVDLWILGYARPEAEVGLYGIAFRLAMFISVLQTVVNSTVAPFIATMHAEGRKKELERLVRISGALTVGPAAVLFLIFLFFGGAIMGRAFGEYYAQGHMVLIVLGLGQLSSSFVSTASFALSMTGHQKVLMNASFCAVVVACVVAVSLVNDYGGVGVAIGTSSAYFLLNLWLWISARRRLGIWTHASIVSFKDVFDFAKRYVLRAKEPIE